MQAAAAAETVSVTAVVDPASIINVTMKFPANLSPRISEQDGGTTISFKSDVGILLRAPDRFPGSFSILQRPNGLTARRGKGSTISISRRRGAILLRIAAPKVEERPQAGSVGAATADAPPVTSADVLPGLPASLVAVVDGVPKAAVASAARPRASVPTGMPSASDGAPGRNPVSGQPVLPHDDTPISVVASVVRSGPEQRLGLMLPYGSRVGAAALQENNELIVVFDSDNPVDLSGVASDPVFGKGSFSLLSSGAVLRLTLPAGRRADVRREVGGWFVAIVDHATQPSRGITPLPQDKSVLLPAVKPGRVLVVPDPAHGTELIVGTVRQDDQGVNVPQSTVFWILKESILGVAVERLSDRVEVRALSAGFSVSTANSELGLISGESHPGTTFSRAADLPDIDVAELQRRYKAALVASASAPAADRRAPRLDAAQAALGLGQGREAGVLASVAEADAPGGNDMERACFLRAAAAVLEAADDAAARLADACIGNSDEVDLWRALEAGQVNPGDPVAAGAITQRLPLLESYPVQLRRELAGMAASSLVRGGTDAQAALVSGLGEGGGVELAKAMLAARQGQTEDALSRFKRLQADADPAVEVAAAEEAVALQMKNHALEPGPAADLLEAQLLNARMAGRELDVGLEVAKLRGEQGNWTAALADLRELSHSFPDAGARIGKVAGDIMQAAVTSNRQGSATPPSPLDQVALIERNLDLLPPGDQMTRVTLALSTRLADLDLPDQAATLLRKTMTESVPTHDNGLLGLRLAKLDLDQNNVNGALGALDATETTTLAPDLAHARALLRAQALAAQGGTDASLEALHGLTGPEADELRARELAIKHDWGGEAAALASLVTIRCSPTGPLTKEGEDLVLRLVEATAQVGDQDAVRRLETIWAPRFPDPDRAAMLRLFTSANVSTVADLPRSATDIAAERPAFAGSEPPSK